MCAFVFVKREGRNKQSRPDASIQAFNLSHNHAHREIPDCIYPFPHMHSCIILADCARDSVQHGDVSLYVSLYVSHVMSPAEEDNTYSTQGSP